MVIMRAMNFEQLDHFIVCIRIADNRNRYSRNQIIIVKTIGPIMRNRLMIAILGAADIIGLEMIEARRRRICIVAAGHKFSARSRIVEIIQRAFMIMIFALFTFVMQMNFAGFGIVMNVIDVRAAMLVRMDKRRMTAIFAMIVTAMIFFNFVFDHNDISAIIVRHVEFPSCSLCAFARFHFFRNPEFREF